MNSNTIQSKDHGPSQLDGHPVKTLPMMSHVRYIKNFTSQRILETLGNISRVMYSISHGEQQHIQLPFQEIKMLSKESLSLMILILKVIKKQEKDGSKASTCITLMTSSRPRRMLLMLEIVL